MLTVPKSNVVSMAKKPEVDPLYMALAAATMHEQGRLFVPEGATEMAALNHAQEEAPRENNLMKNVARALKERENSSLSRRMKEAIGEVPSITPETNDRDNGSAGTKRTI